MIKRFPWELVEELLKFWIVSFLKAQPTRVACCGISSHNIGVMFWESFWLLSFLIGEIIPDLQNFGWSCACYRQSGRGGQILPLTQLNPLEKSSVNDKNPQKSNPPDFYWRFSTPQITSCYSHKL